MGTSDFYNVSKLLRFACQGVTQFLHRRDKQIDNLTRRRYPNRGGKAVIGRLGMVDIVIGMNRLIATFALTDKFIGTVGNHFIHVHVGLGARACLPNHQRKLVTQ